MNLFLKEGISSEYVMADFICLGLLDLWGARTENYKMKTSSPQWHTCQLFSAVGVIARGDLFRIHWYFLKHFEAYNYVRFIVHSMKGKQAIYTKIAFIYTKKKNNTRIEWDDCCYSNWPSLVGPQSLCNESFWLRFMLSRCFLDFSVVVGAFVIGLSQISSLFSVCSTFRP